MWNWTELLAHTDWYVAAMFSTISTAEEKCWNFHLIRRQLHCHYQHQIQVSPY
ncbi:hypothetical protein DPMN_058612 [Dreissena polymorpha]|uniref:Uncharacterized protein n=1 Tax=Dreissena polymorpha TaxID=45954 RepID=A0A9D4C2F2_DREPO|nr:hypothetical protein DPMN_058612 [Dreissena polymorpha]